jgi:dihydroorotase
MSISELLATNTKDWITGSKAAFKGGITTVFDMPNVIPFTSFHEHLKNKINIIETQLEKSGIPIDYKLFLGVEQDTLGEIEKSKDEIVGIKLFMTTSQSDCFLDDDSTLHKIWEIAQKYNLLIATHYEDNNTIHYNTEKHAGKEEIKNHSLVHTVDPAIIASERVIRLAEAYGVKTYILHVSTKEEVELIRKAKSRNVPILAECCPHYLFLDESNYDKLNGKCKINPPVRKPEQKNYMWEAINSGIIDTIASDHAPHTEKEKEKDNIRSKCPSGVPGIETTIPLLLTAWKENRISLDMIIKLMHTNPLKIFNNVKHVTDDFVLANISDYRILKGKELKTKVKWTPYEGMNLTGFPKYIFTCNRLYDCDLI